MNYEAMQLEIEPSDHRLRNEAEDG